MIGIDFTNATLRAVSGRAAKDSIAVQAFNEAAVPLFVNPDGSSDKAPFADAIRQALTSDFKGKEVILLFSESVTVSHRYELPYDANPSAMFNIVRSGLSQTLDTENYVMDYAVLDVFEKDGAQVCDVQVYLAQKKLVDFASEIITMAGRRPHGFQVAENCLFNLHRIAQGAAGVSIIAASLGSKRVNVTLLTGMSNVVSRSASVMPEVESFNSVKSGMFDSSLTVNVAVSEISKMLQYQAIKNPGHTVDNILVFGDYASPDVAAGISEALGTQASILPAPQNISAPAGFAFEKYTYAVGALIEK